MKIEESKSTATIVGDVQSNAVSIDINNIGFITQLLSTNLYSKPIESFLREIVSNAWDSHVEAGVKKPILLEIGTDTENRDYCRIQDFGVGLSPQRFNDIYRNIGSSTKRSDNTQIGGFGIGRFSALAYSGTVYLTSNYQGVKYKYLMYKDGNHIKIDELFNDVTTDEDGLEVMVYIRSGDYRDFKNAIQTQLCYFEDLYVTFERFKIYTEHETFAKSFNNLKIKRYKNFSVNTFSNASETTLCLGKIQYPLNKYSLSNTKFKFEDQYPISVNFEIGDLEVTPNREQILYTKENIKKIEEKLDLVQEELDDIINSQIKQDFDDFEEYVREFKNQNTTVTLYEDEIFKRVVFNVKKSVKNITYKGDNLSESIINLHRFIHNVTIPYNLVTCKVENGRLMTKNLSLWGLELDNILRQITIANKLDNNFFIGDHSKFNNVTKDYIREHCNHGTFFIKKPSIIKITRIFKEAIDKEISRNRMYTKIVYDRKFFKIIVKNILQKLSFLPELNNNNIPDSYIKSRAARLKAARTNSGVTSINWKEEVNLFILRKAERYSYGSTNVASDSERISLENIKKMWNKFPVIYDEKGSVLLKELYSVFRNIKGNPLCKDDYRYYKFVEIAPTKMKILKQFPNFISLQDFMNVKYKKIRKLATATLISREFPHLISIYQMGPTIGSISSKLREISVKTKDYLDENTPGRSYYNSNEILNELEKLCEDHKYYDEEMMGYLRQNAKIIENSKFLPLIRTGSFPESMVNFAVDYILARKLFMPNIDAVKKLKEETIFNIKKEEDENN